MAPKTLKGTVLITVFLFVALSGLALALLVSNIRVSPKPLFKPSVIPEELCKTGRQSIIPFPEAQIQDAAVVACPENCVCSPEHLQWLGLMLHLNAGALARGLLQEEELIGLKSRVESAAGFGEIVGKDPKMLVVYQLIEDVAASDATVLIQGESGTSRELVARATRCAQVENLRH